MMGEVLAYGNWKHNGEMMVDVARLGYLKGRVLDPTYGEGVFWSVYRPKKLVAHDIKHDGVDVRLLPYRRSSFDAAVFDPPYAFRGTATEGFDGKYGVGEYRSADEIMDLYFYGMSELHRVLRPGGYLLVKCQGQVVSGSVRWQEDEIRDHANTLNMLKVDMFVFVDPDPRPQPRRYKKCPKCKPHRMELRGQDDCTVCKGVGRIVSPQQHARRNGSPLIVFQKSY